MSGEGKLKSGACSSDEGRLVLEESGLQELRNIFKHGDSSRDERKQQVLEALKKIGLFWFMRTVWKWQRMEICREFVLNWDPLARKTVVNNTMIDVSLQSFAMVTGLLAEESAVEAEDTKHGSKSEACTAAGLGSVMSQERTDDNVLSAMMDPVCRDLMCLLMKTIWMKICEPKRFPVDLLASVKEAMTGKRMRWSLILYKKFACEMGRLHSNPPWKHPSHGPIRTQRTVAGPVMCFLYIHAKLKAEALVDLSEPVLHDYARMDTILGRPQEIDAAKVEDDVPTSEDTDQKNQSKQRHIQAFQSPVKAPETAAKGNQRNFVPETPVKADQRSIVHQDFPIPKRRKLFHADEGSITLPGCAPVPEDMAAKVLELEYIIARQNAELAECRLRLYAEESKLSRMGREMASR